MDGRQENLKRKHYSNGSTEARGSKQTKTVKEEDLEQPLRKKIAKIGQDAGRVVKLEQQVEKIEAELKRVDEKVQQKKESEQILDAQILVTARPIQASTPHDFAQMATPPEMASGEGQEGA